MHKLFRALEIYAEALFWLIAIGAAVFANYTAITYLVTVFALDDMKAQLQIATIANGFIAVGLRSIRAGRLSIYYLFQSVFATIGTMLAAVITLVAIRYFTNLPTDYAFMGTYIGSLGLVVGTTRSAAHDVKRQLKDAAVQAQQKRVSEQRRRFGRWGRK